MGSLPDAIRELEEDAILWISSLDATAYAPGSSWEPSDVPLAPELDARTLGHLRFDARVVDGEHDALYAGPVSGCSSGEQLDVLLRIVFYWRMPTEGSARRESALAAADAAEHAIRAMCSRPVGAERWTGIRTDGPPRREWVELAGGPVGASWLRVTCDLRVPLFYRRDPVIPLPAGQAPSIYVDPSISGTRGAGNTLTAWPGLSTGTAPITYSYQWLLNGSPISGATASSYVDPDGAGLISVTVTHTNAYGSDSATSQPLGSGGGPVDCAVTCADAIAEAVDEATAPLEAEITALEGEVTTLEGQVASLTAQLAARVPTWRSIGKDATAHPGDVIEHDPSALSNGAITIDADGSVTIPIKGGITSGLPNLGRSIVVPFRDATGQRDVRTLKRIEGAMRVYGVGGIGTQINLRWWIALMNESDPASATVDGIGCFGVVVSGSAHRAGIMRCLNGAWTAATASTDPGDVGPVEVRGSYGSRLAELYAVTQRILTSTGEPPTAGASTQGVKWDITSGWSAIGLNFSAGAWVCLGVGAVGTGVPDVSPQIRGLTNLIRGDQADFVGSL